MLALVVASTVSPSVLSVLSIKAAPITWSAFDGLSVPIPTLPSPIIRTFSEDVPALSVKSEI